MEDIQERINDAANRTWRAIGGDVLTATETDSISRDEVVECVIGYIADYGNDTEAVAELKKLSYEKQEEMLLKAFPFDRYGW